MRDLEGHGGAPAFRGLGSRSAPLWALGLLFLAACPTIGERVPTDASVSKGADSGDVAADGGFALRDSGAADAGLVSDGGGEFDSGGGPEADAGAGLDAAQLSDAGPAPDTGGVPTLPASSADPVVAPAGPTVYVDAVNGTAAGTGTASAPFSTLEQGVAAVAQSGGTVVVREGRYQGPLAIDGLAQPVLIEAAPGEKPVLSCASALSGWQLDSGATWKLTPPGPVAAVFYQGRFLQRARYPATGYLTTAAGGTDQVTLPIAPADAAFLAGKDLGSALATVRIVDYWWNTVVVKSVDASAATLAVDEAPASGLAPDCNPNCYFSYVPKEGWGYFLENEPWMMTEAGSWAWDAAANALYVWLPGDADPNAVEVSYAGPEDCLAISDSPGLVVKGLTVTESGRSGITDSSEGSRFNQVAVRQVKRNGFELQGPFVVDESSVSVTGSAALVGHWTHLAVPSADSSIESSVFTDIGTALGPRFVGAALMVLSGTSARLAIRNNYLARLAYIGTYSAAETLLEGNTFEDFCLLSDDCGGIYVSDRCQGQTVRNNILRRATANLEGKPGSRGAYVVAGIYLDDYSRNMTIEGNVVSEVDMGLMLHNAHDNTFTGNQVFAPNRGSVWIQEDSPLAQFDPATGNFDDVLDANGQPLPSMTSNLFQDNLFADVAGEPLVHQSSNQADTVERLLGAYSGSANTYWNLYSPIVVSGEPGRFGFGELAGQGLDSAPQRCDAPLFGPWATETEGGDVFAASPSSLASFASWSASGSATKAVVACATPSTSGGCLEFTASSSADSLLISPTFAIAGQHFYRLRLQLDSPTSPPPFVSVTVDRNSPPYDNLDALQQRLEVQPSGSGWTVSDLYIQAAEDVSDARVDLQVPQGATVVLGDLVVTEVTVVADSPGRHFQGLVNLDYARPATFACPFSGALCDGWTDRAGVSQAFPVTVAPRGAAALWHP